MQLKYALFAALGVGLIASAPATAQELTGTLKKIKETGTIAIGTRDSSVPFSYYDDKQRTVGYGNDICMNIAEAVKENLKLATLEIKLVPITSANRIPLMANGTIDIECGSTTNNLERQKQVSFTYTHYVTANRFVSKKANNFKTLEDLKGKTVASTSGTSNLKELTELNAAGNLGINIIPVKDHADGFLMVETDRASAFVMDDILLAGLAANSKSPDDYTISAQSLSLQPYGSMIRKDDPAFKKVVDDTMGKMFKDGTIAKFYAKWFTQPIPPKGVNLNVPMSAEFKKVMAHPTDSGDPKDYEIQ